MKVLHLNAGNETGGGMYHILLLLQGLPAEEVILGVFEEGELAKRARELGITTMLFNQHSRKDLSVIKRITKVIETENIDIVHTHGPRANLYGVFINPKTTCKWVTTIHSNPDDDFLGQGIKGKVFTILNKWSIKKADHLLAISERFKHMLESYGIASRKITTIVNGVDFSIDKPTPVHRSEFQLNDEDFVVLMVARLEKVKEHHVALQAIRKVVDKNPHIKLLLAGEGSEKNRINDEIMKLSLESHVFILGERKDVNHLLELADIGLLTSRSESFPLVLLEAARAGKPVITTDVGGVQWMIPTTDYGWIVDVGSSEQISEAILEAISLKSEKSLNEMGTKFRIHCESNFSIEKQKTEVYNAYQKILNTK